MRSWVVGAVGFLGLLGSGAIGVPAAAAAKPPKPVVVALAASPSQLPARGGSLRLTVRVRNATTCTFRLEQTAFASQRCAGGSATSLVQVQANALQRTVTLHVAVQVAGRGGKVSRTIAVGEAAAPAPLAVATTSLAGATSGASYSAPLGATGGTPPYTWTISSGSLPLGLSLATGGTIAGTPTSSGTFPLTVQVTDAAGQTATASLSLAVAPRTLAVGSQQTSSNWSGYALDGGPFVFATGTFTVPSVGSIAAATDTSEWVGVDGDSGTNQDLIQAGVSEDTTSDGSIITYAWWEILPAVATPIETVDVQAGDTVTVTLEQLSPGSWSIQLVDDTNDQSFATTQSYSGRGLSAEWIVESGTDANSNTVLPLGEYSPPVAFTGIGWSAGLVGGWTPIQLDQGNGPVSTPSALDRGQTAFTVGYGSSPPPSPS